MISIIVPFMDIGQYGKCLKDLKKSLKKQTVPYELIVEKQPVSRFINKQKLLNQGFKKSTGDYIWHCDADYLLISPTLLERMEKAMEPFTVIYPKFFARSRKKWRLADGGPFMHRDTLVAHGPLNEKLEGIGFVTFPFLLWCLKHRNIVCSDDFAILTNGRLWPKSKKQVRIPRNVYAITRPIAKNKVIPILKEKGWW